MKPLLVCEDESDFSATHTDSKRRKDKVKHVSHFFRHLLLRFPFFEKSQHAVIAKNQSPTLRALKILLLNFWAVCGHFFKKLQAGFGLVILSEKGDS